METALRHGSGTIHVLLEEPPDETGKPGGFAEEKFSEKYNRLAKISKDTAAGAVLVGAIFAVCTGIAILGQPEAFKAMFVYYAEKPYMIAVLVLSLALSFVFIFTGFHFKKKNK